MLSLPPEKWNYLSCRTEEVDGEIVLQVEGEIDLASANHFEAWLNLAHALGLPVTVDLRKVAYMDSAGIKILETNNRTHIKMTLLIAPGTLSKLLALSDLDQRFIVREGGSIPPALD